jgi:hypothetical protein
MFRWNWLSKICMYIWCKITDQPLPGELNSSSPNIHEPCPKELDDLEEKPESWNLPNP